MNIQEIIEYENESTYVDFKKFQYHNNEDFLKDIMSMSNADIDINKRYIIIGIKHLPDGRKEFDPIEGKEFKDDSDYQELVN
ncbi:hypothetical protein KZ483_26075 [Paenibacillus sp. sptzw28]|uniref:hypothetical protein n=1 Tax=Paenibacillus sp. sptzw28 TaxID=715179 RepID=UPI001C6F42E7|nr:hypothetical protein [Paenibacillus sp. sptzw28]QYR21135.1 hypothetical protein KZ483_26075 [Paenibacillus sp. sptzw28]